MSSLITAGRFLVASQDKKLSPPVINNWAFRILAEVIQNVLDGYYQKVWNTKLHYIHLRDIAGSDGKIAPNPVWPLLANIVGISLGDGDDTVFLTDRKSIQNCIDGVRWNIRVLYEFNGEIIGIELSTIRDITKKKVFQIVPQVPQKENPDTPIVETSVVGISQRRTEEAIAA